ncbi:MAG: MBL fold metallo-hydrolase [Ignavibacteriaceae bacterium]
MTIKQIRSDDGTGTLSYIVIDDENKLAALIDPNIEDVKQIKALAKDLQIKVTHIFDTHTHADHISGAEELKKIFDSKVYMHEKTKNKFEVLKNAAKFGIEDILEANAKIKIDTYLNEEDKIKIGNLEFKVLYTPGHTDNHISLLVENAVFTGDLLLIGQAGRSDLPGGNSKEQYESLFNKIAVLPEKTKIYPGHDYENNEYSLLKDELKNNPFLQKRTKEQYVDFVKDFFPPAAEAMTKDGKMSLQCGTKRVVQNETEFKTISVSELADMLDKKENIFLLDVRNPIELLINGKVDSAVNIPLNELSNRLNEILEDKSKKIVCICASGNRSVEASHLLAAKGYKNVLNLNGGTNAWINEGYATLKS